MHHEGIDFNSVNRLETHMLLEKETRRIVHLHLCKWGNCGTRLKWTKNGCVQCRTGFHVNFIPSFTEELRWNYKGEIFKLIISIFPLIKFDSKS